MEKRKVVLVTGASRGIGKSTIEVFAKNNYDVVINYLDSKEEAMLLKEKIENTYKVNALIVKSDISKEDEVKLMIEEIVNHYGCIDVLVNNAGIAIDTTFEDKTKDNFMKTLEVNLVGTFLVSKYVSKYMLEQKRGSIINVSSTNGLDTNYVESLDYDASKAGVISLTHNLAKYLAPYIRVNCVCPGWINTDMNKDLSEDFKKCETEKVLLKRFANPIEVANVIYFLASDKASYINDSIIRVDGGCE